MSGYVLFDVVALAVTARLLRGRHVPVPAPAPRLGRERLERLRRKA